jgi:hypothetical protein
VGLNDETTMGLHPADGGGFSLDIPFYRTCPERPIGEQEIDFLLDRVRNDFVSHD